MNSRQTCCLLGRGAGGSSVLFEHQAEAEPAGSILRVRGAFPVPWKQPPRKPEGWSVFLGKPLLSAPPPIPGGIL